MNETQATELLSAMNASFLISHWKRLDSKQKEHLLAQLKRIDLPTLHLQQQMLIETIILETAVQDNKDRSISPFEDYEYAGNEADKKSGKKIISEGLVGSLIVAGGQGSRLNIEGPKGVCQVSKVRKKSLFQLFSEKVAAAGKQAGRLLPFAIMTSPLNHEDTVAFFQKHDFFGLTPKQVFFFQQEMLPLLDTKGHVFLESQDTLSEGPDGNGGALHQFFKSGIWEDWHSKGIRYVNFLPIDNPLADPFDAELIGFQKRKKSDSVIKCTMREDPEESVGILIKEKGKAGVIEYSELTPQVRCEISPEGKLSYPLANLSLFSFNMEFIKLVAETFQPILHKAFKAVKFLDKEGHSVKAEKPMAWKFEKFIFDILPLASNVHALVYPRESCFAPLKNLTGSGSFEEVAAALEVKDRQILSAITGSSCTAKSLEISQEFYYPMPELLAKWKGKVISQEGYIEPKNGS